MLIQRFMQKHQNVIVGKGTSRDTEIRIQALVVREFERFIKEQTFTQKKLAQFEIVLVKKIEEVCRDPDAYGIHKDKQKFKQNTNEAIKSPKEKDQITVRTGRGLIVNHNEMMDKRLKNNFSLPQINRNSTNRNSTEFLSPKERMNSLNVDRKIANSLKPSIMSPAPMHKG